MDDKSPAYENFMNKMSAMNSGPKIKVTTMKFGGLEKRVANNERKITSIKNIFKSQKINIGDKISPSTSPAEILSSTNETLIRIKEQLELDFINTKKTEKDRLALEKQLLQRDQADNKETEIETVKKNNKFVRDSKKKILSPFVSIFDKLKELSLILGTGLLVNNIANLMSKPEFVDGLKNIFDWTTKNWKLIAGVGATLVGLNLLGSLGVLLGIGKTLLAIVTSKAFIAGALLLGPGLLEIIPDDIKRAITELEMRGGATEENRKKLKEELLKELYSIKGIDLTGRRSAINKMIKFLDTGIIEGPGVKVKLDFKKYNQGVPFKDAIIRKEKDFHDGGYNPSGIGNVHAGEFVLKKSAVEKIGLENLYRMNDGKGYGNIVFEERDPIDARVNKIVKDISNLPATVVARVNSTNISNSYMKEVPVLFGFNDLVYT